VGVSELIKLAESNGKSVCNREKGRGWEIEIEGWKLEAVPAML
jgi:hypothetical protein